jgi:hypothetical protein
MWDGNGWLSLVVALLGVKAVYVALGAYFLGWGRDYRLPATLADFLGVLIAWLA